MPTRPTTRGSTACRLSRSGLGSDHAPRDIELADVLVDDVVFVDDMVSFAVQIKATGLEGQPAKVMLRREGDADAAAPNSRITLGRRRRNRRPVCLTDRPTAAGDVTYVVEVRRARMRRTATTIARHATVSVRDDKIRVLVGVGYPSYEFRFLKTLLERDTTIQLSTYLQDADPDYAPQDKTALRSFRWPGRFVGYDVIMVGDVDPRLVPRSGVANVRAFVAEKGGGVVFVAGPRFLPWLYHDVPDVAALLPIELDGPCDGRPIAGRCNARFCRRADAARPADGADATGRYAAATEQIWRTLAPLYWLRSSID